MAEPTFEMVGEIPEVMRRSSSQYDPIAERVRKSGKVARISSSKKAMTALAARLKKQYPDLDAKSRTTDEGFFVYLAQKESK